MRPFAGLAREASHAGEMPQYPLAVAVCSACRGYEAMAQVRMSEEQRAGFRGLGLARDPKCSRSATQWSPLGAPCGGTREHGACTQRLLAGCQGLRQGRSLGRNQSRPKPCCALSPRCSKGSVGRSDTREIREIWGTDSSRMTRRKDARTRPREGMIRWENWALSPFMRARNIGAHSFRQRLKKCLAPICALFVYRCIHQRKQQGWTGMPPACFRGRCMHQIVGAFQTVHNPLRASCSPFFPGATAVYFPRTPVCSQEYGKGCTSSLFQVVLQLSGARS